MKWFRIFGGISCAVIIFGVSLYFLLTTFVKKPEADLPLRKEYTHIQSGDEKLYDIFFVGPDTKLKIKLLRGEDVIYDQVYDMNHFMLRGPDQVNPKATRHAIFAGCSFTWGEGLKAEDAFSSQFQKYSPDYQGYNHSFPGGGLHSLIRYHDFFKLEEAVKEKEGIFLYTFIPTHLDRYFLRYNYLSLFPDTVPHYKVESGKLVYKGIVRDQKVYSVYKAAHEKGLGDTLINTQDPYKWSSEELDEYTIAVQHLKNIYLQKFPKGHFYFLFHPLGNPPDLKEQIKTHLVKAGIDVIDLAHEFGLALHQANLTYDDMFIPYDGHPNAKSNELGSQALREYFAKGKISKK